jgi:hypothetical protein
MTQVMVPMHQIADLIRTDLEYNKQIQIRFWLTDIPFEIVSQCPVGMAAALCRCMFVSTNE